MAGVLAAVSHEARRTTASTADRPVIRITPPTLKEVAIQRAPNTGGRFAAKAQNDSAPRRCQALYAPSRPAQKASRPRRCRGTAGPPKIWVRLRWPSQERPPVWDQLQALRSPPVQSSELRPRVRRHANSSVGTLSRLAAS